MNVIKSYLLALALFLAGLANAQNYQAIHGSSYAGSLGAASNPASIVHVPYAWDITPLSIQVKQATNAYKIEKYSLLSSPATAEASPLPNVKKRFVFANQDIHLLNTRVNLNSKAAIAFGLNIRSYLFGTTGTSNWQDSVFTMYDFMHINANLQPLSGEAAATSWAELYGTYARNIIDGGDWLINAGITVKVNRGLAGGYVKAENLGYTTDPASQQGYLLRTGVLRYGYSSSFDVIDSNKTASANRKAFLNKTFSRIGVDAGIEYIHLADEDEGESDDYAYETKLGLSLRDIGATTYQHGSRSRLATAGRVGVTDTVLENKFTNIGSFDDFNDSLSELTASFRQLYNNFSLYQPARFVINLDQHITQNFFVNAELTIPLFPIFSKNSLYIKDMNLLALTPRWEVKSMGAYFPILFNARKQLWVGGAFKAGPVLFGTHNLANLFSKNKAQAGGMYLALTIRPGKMYDRQAHYPGDKLSRKERQRLRCPAF